MTDQKKTKQNKTRQTNKNKNKKTNNSNKKRGPIGFEIAQNPGNFNFFFFHLIFAAIYKIVHNLDEFARKFW